VLNDMPTVKLDPSHYFFSLPITSVMIDDDDEVPPPKGDNNQNEVKRKSFAPSCNRFWCLIY
jgi:hypothetical protein